MVILAQTSASLHADDHDDVVTRRMSAGAGVPAFGRLLAEVPADAS
jgi:hypothetical protein